MYCSSIILLLNSINVPQCIISYIPHFLFWEDIGVSLLKHVKQKIVNGLVIIFNNFFEEERFPEMLKSAKVVPIFKGENPTDPNNYRPISLLNVFDKLLEKVMYNSLNAFLTKHKIFYKYQLQFRKKSCNCQCLV